MMKRMFCLLLTVLMGVSCIFASAEDAQDNSADALTLAELQAFAARMQTLAMASTPLNDPADAKTEDGVSVELRGNDKVNVATWSNGGFVYSVSSEQGISETEVAAVISSAL